MESFGRRRRTKVPEERTRGPRTGYGDLRNSGWVAVLYDAAISGLGRGIGGSFFGFKHDLDALNADSS